MVATQSKDIYIQVQEWMPSGRRVLPSIRLLPLSAYRDRIPTRSYFTNKNVSFFTLYTELCNFSPRSLEIIPPSLFHKPTTIFFYSSFCIMYTLLTIFCFFSGFTSGFNFLIYFLVVRYVFLGSVAQVVTLLDSRPALRISF